MAWPWGWSAFTASVARAGREASDTVLSFATQDANHDPVSERGCHLRGKTKLTARDLELRLEVTVLGVLQCVELAYCVQIHLW